MLCPLDHVRLLVLNLSFASLPRKGEKVDMEPIVPRNENQFTFWTIFYFILFFVEVFE